MYSIGRFISNFRDFYNDINGATLTGAIDVVVVQQPDGSFTCSPFHVRFGKLGVLRSKEKLVDIEINGESRDIHMKLGESGEAFFVEGVYEGDDSQYPEHLATSPITVSEFEPSFGTTPDEIPKPRRNSIQNTQLIPPDKYENQVSDFSQRRYTDQSLQKRDLSTQKKEYTTQQLREQEQRMQESWNAEAQGQESLFSLESLEGSTSTSSVQNNGATVKIFKAEKINDENSQDNERSRKVSTINNDFRPIDAQDIDKSSEEISIIDLNKDDSTKELSETLLKAEDNGKSNNKKKRRKRSVMKKKSAQRKNSNSSSGGSHSDQMEVEVSEGNGSENHNSSSGTQEDSSVSSKQTNDTKDDLQTSESIRIRDPDIHFFSDTEVGNAQSPRGSRPCTPVQSDTEFEVKQRQDNNSPGADSRQSWRWGELPSPRPKNNVSTTEPTGEEDKKKLDEAKQAERNSMLSNMFSFMKQTKRLRAKAPVEGLYLADLSSEDMDPEVAALYFPSAQIHRKRNDAEGEEEEDLESGNGPSLTQSLTQSPSSMEGVCGGPKSVDSDFDDNKHHEKHNEEVQLSLCGGLETGGPSHEEFQNHLVPYNEVCQNPHLLESPNLVVRLGGKYYNWKTACPIVMTLVVYQQPLPQSSIEQLSDSVASGKSIEIKTGEIDSTKEESEGRSYWWYWRRPDKKSAEQKLADGKKSLSIDKAPEIVAEAVESKDVVTSENINIPGAQEGAIGTQTNFSISPEEIHKEDGYSGSQSSEESDIEPTRTHIKQRPFPEKYRKTLRLSSEQIESLNLNEGMNEVVFSVTTAYQGTSRCKCYMYRWKHDDKVVISDIDGTITKSDVLGHLLPIVGKDWAQSGVAQLFTKIKNNGYKLLYLSSRAIGQARVTREYLRSIKQNDLSLPDGPLLLNPTSLLSAFHREVIEKKPEQFKISCLSDIQALFPSDTKPFYAGYGNRINDVWAYRAVGIPIVRIFTINHKGELKHELTQTFQSSYSNMSYIVDQLFPPLLEDASEFSHFVYWRDPLPEVPPLNGDIILPVTSSKSSSPPRGTSPLPTIPEHSITN